MTEPLRLYVANLPHRKLANTGILLPLQPMRQDAPRVLAAIAGATQRAIRGAEKRQGNAATAGAGPDAPPPGEAVVSA